MDPLNSNGKSAKGTLGANSQQDNNHPEQPSVAPNKNMVGTNNSINGPQGAHLVLESAGMGVYTKQSKYIDTALRKILQK